MRRPLSFFAIALATVLTLPLHAQDSESTFSSQSSGAMRVVAPTVVPAGITLRHRSALPALPSASPLMGGAPEAPAPAPRADGFASGGFAQFMASPAGRILRVVAGAGMIAGGIAADSDAGTAVAIVGAVPLLAGAFDFCILSPLFGGPLSGKAIRAAK